MEADKLLEQANKLGTQASTQTGVPFTAITPKSLTETPKLATLPTVPVSTTAQGISATAGAMSEQAKLNAERDKQLAASRSAVEEQKGVYQGLVEQITGVFGQKDKLATQYKLDEKQQKVTDVTNKIEASQRAQEQEIRALENSGLTDVQKAQQSREINRKYAFERADLAVIQSAANRDFETAQNIIESKIKLQLEPLKFQLDFSKGFYDEVKNDLDTATKNDFDAKIKQLDRQFKSEEENRNAIGELQITALKNGIDIPQSVLNKLNNAKDVNEAASILANAGISLAKPEKAKSPDGSLKILDIQRYQELYPEAGIVAGDTEAQANAKVAAISTPEAKLRTLITSAKDNGNDYDAVITEIDNDSSIKDKATAKSVAQEVFGISEDNTQNSALEDEISRLKSGGILNNSDIRNSLRSRGYTQSEINNSSVGNIIEQIGSFLFR